MVVLTPTVNKVKPIGYKMTEYPEQTHEVSIEKPLAFVIEDEAHLANIFATALSQAGYRTKAIGDGQEALQQLSVTVPALVVLDLHLPHVPGQVIFDYIRIRPQLSQTRIILATADARLTESLSRKADLVLLKPVSFQQLRDLAGRMRPPEAYPDK
jgi:CheY-like chemotaxis protein